MNITDQQWEVYRLTNQEGLSLEDTAKEMGVCEIQVMLVLRQMRDQHPDLFTDISSDGRRFDHGVSRYGGWCEGDVVKKF